MELPKTGRKKISVYKSAVHRKHERTVPGDTQTSRHLCFNASGDQITPLEKKLASFGIEIAYIQSKHKKHKPEFKKYTHKLAMLWRKFLAINKALFHLTANAIVMLL
jgi:hypothetical protein